MKKLVIGIVIIGLYGFPYVYFSMYQDFTKYTMIGYFMMILATGLLAYFSRRFVNSIPMIIGNLLSMISSYYFIKKMEGTEQWGSYFSPLSPEQLLIFVPILNLVPQFFSMMLVNKGHDYARN